MSNNVDLNIVLKLLDEASGQLKKTLGDAKDQAETLGKRTQEAGDKTNNAFKESNQQLRQFRSNVVLATGIVFGFVNATREYARYNASARESLNDVEVSFHKLAYSAGEAIEKLKILQVLQQSMKGWGMIGDLVTGNAGNITNDQSPVTEMVKAEQTLRDFKQQQSDVNTLFMAGQSSSAEYYAAITDAEYNVQMVRQASMQQMQQLAMLEMQIGNDSFMNAQRLTQERINLLNFYSQTYMTAHQGMAAFTVMLGQTIQTNLSKALLDVTMNVHNSKDAFKQLEKAMIQAILNFMIQKAVAFALEKTLLAGTVASTSAAAAAIAIAWAPAAIAASVATLGGAAATGTAAYTASLATGIASTTASVMASQTAGRSISVESQMSGGGQVLSQTPGWGGPQANGGDYMVNRPTLFLAGEAGPERATFTPIGNDGASIGAGGRPNVYIEISIDRPTVSNRDDIDYLAEQVSKKLALEVERIR